MEISQLLKAILRSSSSLGDPLPLPMATHLLPPTILPPINPRLRRPIFLPARVSSPVPSSGDAKRRWWALLFRSIVWETLVSEEDPKIAEETADAATEGSERRSMLTAEKAKVLRR